jgi:hypothetical protein
MKPLHMLIAAAIISAALLVLTLLYPAEIVGFVMRWLW